MVDYGESLVYLDIPTNLKNFDQTNIKPIYTEESKLWK